MSQVAIKCRTVEKSYGSGGGRVWALRGLDLDARFGELLMIAGPSGCGKTTLLSIVCGILQADKGEVELLGTSLSALSDSTLTAFRSTRVGFIFQQFNLIPTLTARENVAIPLVLNGHPYPSAQKQALAMLARLGLKDRADHFPSQLSGGQQQRVAISRALVHNPQLVICDEPTSALDAASGLATMSLLREVALAPDRCVVVVTHDSRIFGFADRIVSMEDGEVTDIREKSAPSPIPT